MAESAGVGKLLPILDVGLMLGAIEGVADGATLGIMLGRQDGVTVGRTLGLVLGDTDGAVEGITKQ